MDLSTDETDESDDEKELEPCLNPEDEGPEEWEDEDTDADD